MINARGSAVSPPAAPRFFSPPLRVAIVGAGPAGIHAAGALAELAPGTKIDMFERLPTPYGLVRYGLAPGHAESEKFVDSLHTVLVASDFRLFCNVEIGKDLSVEDLRSSYDAVIIATGAPRDALLDIPGVELPGSFGAADFVGWYNDHPDAPPTLALARRVGGSDRRRQRRARCHADAPRRGATAAGHGRLRRSSGRDRRQSRS
ncbi:FAD-dependent oxidoreductase [Rhodococcus erythropolis]|uniref:FAD-dependent oxidoreductase n=1 Tax=Rhodococcus erythropolis TaxID=1833 RepID=UPI0021655F8D|nr:FAD-dependent oxidoreductase [Rhodococcus erythropolis]